MATLETVQGGSLVSDPTSSLNLLLQTFGTAQSRGRERQVQEQVDILAGGVGGKKEEAALVRLSALNPQAGNAIRQALQQGDTQALAAANAEAEKGFRQSVLIQDQKTFAGKRNALLSLGRAEAAREGGDPSRILKLLDLPEEKLNTELQRMRTMGEDIKTLTQPRETFTPVLDAAGRITGQRSSLTGEVKADPRAGIDPFRESKLPTRQRIVGTETIFEELDPETGEFIEISRGPRFAPPAAKAPAGPESAIGKINADFARGLITAEQRDAGIAKAIRGRDPLVQIDAFEKESARLGARSDAVVRDEIKGNARSASRQLSKVRSLSKILETADTGTFQQFAPQLARVIPFFDATNEQAAQAQISSFVLDEMAKFKGSTSDRELAFARETITQLGNTPEANKIILRNLENVIFLSGEENRQFDEFVKGENKPRDFIFDFQKVIIPDHPNFGNVTLDDLQTTAFENGISIERALKELRKR